MSSTDSTMWFALFLIAAAAAVALGVTVAVMWTMHQRERQQLLGALGALAGPEQNPLRAARLASAKAIQQDAALAELRAIVETAPFGIVALDQLGRVLTANPAAERMLGLPPLRTQGRLIIELVRAPELETLLVGAHETGRNAESELSFALQGNRRVARAVAAPLQAASSDATCLLVLEDLTELRRLESVRSDFVANVSHELRTPVTNVRGYAETLLESFQLEPQARGFVQVIQRNATRLGSIIEDLLLLASLEGAESAPPMEPVPLHAVLHGCMEQHTPVAAAKRIKVECHSEPGLTVLGSAGLLGQAVGNLLENALKYSPEGTRVQIHAQAQGDEAVVEVRDQGPGVPPQHLPRIFERFYRVDKARSRDSGGTGLGLSIVKHVAQTHGGSVEVESRSGVGSVFRIRLPRAVPGRVAHAPQHAA